MRRLIWTTRPERGYTTEVAYLGPFEATITAGGSGTIGANVFVGTFIGRVVAISASFEDAERAVIRAAAHDMLMAEVELRKVLE